MARFARAVAVGLPYRVTRRGNRRGNVFFEDADRAAYLADLACWCALREREVWG